jgi:hypothetical protein
MQQGIESLAYNAHSAFTRLSARTQAEDFILRIRFELCRTPGGAAQSEGLRYRGFAFANVAGFCAI